jgi:amino acid transporter
MVVGTIIGASIFVQPSEITRQMPSVTGIVLVWLAAGVLTLFGALVCAELSSAFPRTGGVYVFLREAYSPVVGFLWGWAMFWSMHSGIIAAIAVVFARYANVFTGIDPRVIAVGVIVLLSAVNYVGVKHGGLVQNVFTAAKLAAIGVIIAAGLLWTGATPQAVSAAAMSRFVGSSSRSPRACSLTAAGTWSPTPPARRRTRPARSRARCSWARSSSPPATRVSTRFISASCRSTRCARRRASRRTRPT